MMWIINFFTKTSIGLVILKTITIIAAVIVVFFGARQAGRRTEQVRQLELNHRAMRKANAIDTEIDSLPNGAALGELRRDWSR